MRKHYFLKSTLCLLMALVCNVAWAEVLPTEPIKASQNLPAMGIPECQFYVRGAKNGGHYWNSSTVNTNDVANAGKFAFYAVPGLSDCYYIYSVDAKKWVNYNKTNRYNQKSFVEVADNFDANAYWKITPATKQYDNTSCYQMQPTVYTTNQGGVLNIQGDRYANWYQGVDGSSTLGLWQQSPSDDEGSAWSLISVDVTGDLDALLAQRIALANQVIASVATYEKGTGILTTNNVGTIMSSPYTSTAEGSIAKLVDGSAGKDNHWHSDYGSNKVNGSHYIVANLGEQTPENLSFMYKRRNGAASDQTTRWAIYGVPADETGVSEDSRAGLTLLAVISTPHTGATDVFENLPPFKTKGFKKFRIYADATNQNRGYFHIGEFQLYGNTLADSNTDDVKALVAALTTAESVENATQGDIDALNEKLSVFLASEEDIEAAREALACEGVGYPTANNAQRLALQEVLTGTDIFKSSLDAAVTAYKSSSADIVLPEYGKAYKMAFKTKAGALHHIVANEKTLALSVDANENNASVFYCMASGSDEAPYVFVSAEGGFLTFKALSDAYINKVTDFKVAPMTGVTNNVDSSVESRFGTVYIATNKRPDSDKEDDGCFVFKNQDNTYDGADVPFHKDSYTSAIVMTEVAAESKTVYNIAVEGNDDAKANAYVAYDNGNVVRRAFNEGFFVTNGTITEAQLKAGFVGNVVKSATIIVEGNAITLSDVVTFPTPVKQDLYNTSKGDGVIPPYRIPGITVDPETGRIITAAARLVCGTDPGYGQVDVVCRTSDDNGETWSDMIEVAVGDETKCTAEKNVFEIAFGDPAIVADRTSREVLVIAVAGCTVYADGNTTRQNPNMIATIHSADNGETWGKPVDVTEPIYSLFDSGNPIQSAFVGGGKIFQSRIVKVGQYYRLYAAMCARPNGNRVIYSDDFGRTWHALGGASALPAPGGDEPKCEELPDGRVILSSRATGGRIYNIYTYTNTLTAEGSWEGHVMSTFAGSGKTPGGNSTNGEILIVPVKRNSDQKEMYLALQSLPTGGGRSHVGIFYKELTDMTDIKSVANFATDWNGFYLVTDKASAYSSMDLQADNRIGFIYEETLTGWGKRDNPVSTCFPTGDGQHNFDGYDNIYVAYPLEIITNNAYSIKRNVNRKEYLQTYFTALTEDIVEELKEPIANDIAALSAEPTIGEVDKIYFTLSKESAVTAFDEHAGKVGYYLDAAVATYKEEVVDATTHEQLAAAETKLITTNKWNMPVSGKAYTFKNVQKDGTTMRWYKYDGTNIVLTANEAEATPFVCRLLGNGKYVFVCNGGKYMTWRAVVYGCTTTGVNDVYHGEGNFLTDITIEKMTAGGQIASGVDLSNTRYVSISANRPDKQDPEKGYVVVKKNGGNPTFDGAGAAYYNDNFSSAFIMEEVEVPFGNAKVNNVEESKLMSEDLHGKSMSTFSSIYATVAPEGVTAYYATKEGDNVVLNAIAKGKAIPAYTGVILVAEQGGNAVMLPPSGETAADVTGNLMGHSAGEAKDMSRVANAYILTGGAQGAGFYRCTSGTLAANKAYLVLPQQAGANAPAVRIRLAGDQGGTTEVEMPIANGQQPTAIYDLHGRRVANPTKGVYIVNGKKVLF